MDGCRVPSQAVHVCDTSDSINMYSTTFTDKIQNF